MITQVSTLSGALRSSAMTPSEVLRMVMVNPTEKRPNRAATSTIHGYFSCCSALRPTRSRHSSGHGTTTTSSTPGASKISSESA